VTAELSARRTAEIAQTLASDPAVSAWVGASAGSGKTKVLTDRVLRLLLQEGQAPNRILCLTFTRAAAAEMKTRLARRLGDWACMEEAALAAELTSLGCAPSPALLQRARALFAEVLELPGGMRISTIHSFCQSLLGAFPLEAGLPPQFAVLEDADAAALLAEAREAVLGGALAAEARLSTLARLTGAEEFSSVVGALLGKRDRLASCLRASNGIVGLRFRLADLLELDDAEDEAAIRAAACRIPDAVAREAASWANHRHKHARALCEAVRAFLDQDEEARASRWEDWCALFLTDKGTPRAFIKDAPALEAECARILAVREKLAAARLLEATEALLALAGPVLEHYEARKRSAGLLAYDDLIATASKVLRDPGSAWVLFKLDGGLDHVLLDEAQDTNPAQWEIASALTEEFFAGFGAELAGRGERGLRTIFAVGDIKQAIYGFQGADARGFGAWEGRFRKRVSGRGGESAFRRVEMNVSFRSTAPVLALVDAVFAEGPARAGVVEGNAVLSHLPDRVGQAGEVELWPLLRPAEAPKPLPWEIPEEPQRVADGTALMAEALAARIARMVEAETLPARSRRIRPGDVLVLVRRLANVPLVPLLVRALKERGVAVAGVGRQTLIEHIAVMDLLALMDSLLLPEDDLQLAALLRSPLVGLSDEALFELAHGRSGPLWSALLRHRGEEDTALGRAAEWLARLAGRADLVTPHALLAEVLGEPAEPGGPPGRARLLARLGPDAAEPLDELLNAALTYENRHPPSLQGFVHWLRRGGAEVKREAETGADAVRIMTVHNAKGLQAPVVILPDVGGGEARETLRWTGPAGEGEEAPALPLWAPRKEFHAPAFLAAMEEDQRKRQEEENRLLYVALTRAEDRLLVCGWGKEPKDWYRLVAAGFRRLPGLEEAPFDAGTFGAPPACDFGGEALRRLACPQAAPPAEDRGGAARAASLSAEALPAWAGRPAPPEAPEAAILPSSLPGEEETPAAAAPHGASDPGGRRFRRGRLVHALLQHLPERSPAERGEAGRRFLARPGHGLDPAEQVEVLEEVLALLESPEIAAAFGPGSLAEAPIAGRIAGGGRLIAGQVDRLVVGPERVLVLDYKTNRPPPDRAEAVAPVYLRQMAAYRALLRQAFPGRAVDCALVWTHGARVMRLPEDLLDRHAPE
jgi:ATP-dependent helicase/nuclease subunit A